MKTDSKTPGRASIRGLLGLGKGGGDGGPAAAAAATAAAATAAALQGDATVGACG